MPTQPVLRVSLRKMHKGGKITLRENLGGGGNGIAHGSATVPK